MKSTDTANSYQRAAIEGASPIGLIVVLFDRLVRDLRSAVTAMHEGDIETRCRVLNHGMLVLGQLENWVDRETGGEAAETLCRFYGQIRSNMLQASVTQSTKLLDEQIELVLQVRTAWQQIDIQSATGVGVGSSMGKQEAFSALHYAGAEAERVSFSQSA
jgi:flagellar protein FliS